MTQKDAILQHKRLSPGLNINAVFPCMGIFIIRRWSYIYHCNSYTGKTTSLYWSEAHDLVTLHGQWQSCKWHGDILCSYWLDFREHHVKNHGLRTWSFNLEPVGEVSRTFPVWSNAFVIYVVLSNILACSVSNYIWLAIKNFYVAITYSLWVNVQGIPQNICRTF